MPGEQTAERALEVAVEARTLALTAHDRVNSVDAALRDIRADISDLKTAVSSLSTKVAIAAGVCSLIGGGAVAVILTFLPTH